jgi:hypothetical protein
MREQSETWLEWWRESLKKVGWAHKLSWRLPLNPNGYVRYSMLVSEVVMGKYTSMSTSVIQYIPLLDVCIKTLLGRYLLCIIVTCYFTKEPRVRPEVRPWLLLWTCNCISTTPVNVSIFFLSPWNVHILHMTFLPCLCWSLCVTVMNHWESISEHFYSRNAGEESACDPHGFWQLSDTR